MRFNLKAARFGAWSLDLTTRWLTTSKICKANFVREPGDPFILKAPLPDNAPYTVEIRKS